MSVSKSVAPVRARLVALLRKEFSQIRRDRRMAVSLIVPPVLQVLLFGFALNSNVSDLKLGVLDESRTPESRELVAKLTQSRSFVFSGSYEATGALGADISRGRDDAGVVIPYEFARDLHRGQPTQIQFILNASNANTANIGRGYLLGVLANYNQELAEQGIHAQVDAPASQVSRSGSITVAPAYMYNPGLLTNWFILTGTLGMLIMLNGTLVASTAMIKEREAGTLEQLLMTPASTAEVIIAKITPIFVLLTGTIVLALVLIRTVFAVPMHGNFLLVLGASWLCLVCGIGIGTMIATLTKSAQQSQLLSFFVNPPLASLSGALAPIEAMPQWMQPLTYLNPIRYFAIIMRSVMLKRTPLAELWPNFLMLLIFAVVLMTVSVSRFRKQLS